MRTLAPSRSALVFAALCLGALLASWLRHPSVAVTASAEGLAAGSWVALDELSWDAASTGWLGVANQHVPQVDRAFTWEPLSMGGEPLARGVGTYPFSEITYRLDGAYDRFAATAGLDDATPAGPDAVRFLVFADGILRYESPPVRAGDPPVDVDAAVAGARLMRLVVAAEDRATGLPLYADWGEPRLLRPLVGEPPGDAAWRQFAEGELARRGAALVQEESALADQAATWLAHAAPAQNGYFEDVDAGWVGLENGRLLVAVGVDGPRNGRLYVLDRRTGRVAIDGASLAAWGDGGRRVLADGRAGTPRVDPVERPGLGRGERLVVPFGGLDLRLTLFEDAPYFVCQLVGGPDDTRFGFLADAPTVALGDGAEYFTDFSRLRHARVRDDGLTRREGVGPGKPVYLWSEQTDRGLLIASLDESEGPTELVVRRDPGRVLGALGFTTGRRSGASDAARPSSPRLYVELPPSVDLRQSHRNFERVSAALRPPAPLPAWVKYQWITWYAFNVDIDEEKIRRQVDYIADNLADLGPWHVLIDAGWYVAEGRPGADWRNVDRDKFPSGMRALVDYAHSRGVKVMGYVSAPYLDSRERRGDWLGLRDVIERHPDWLVRLGGDETRQSYAFDFAQAPVRDYWASVIRDLLVTDDMDALKLDGLGNAEGAQLSPDTVDQFGRVELVAGQAMDIYRFFHEQVTAVKPDAYVQAGWMTPTFANPYAHAFWYGDDAPTFTNPYPFPGLREKVDYATIQARNLGQRSNMGNVLDDPNTSTINRWWLEAGLALGTQVALSFDLTAMSPQTLAAYRHLLVHYDAFRGERHFGPGLYPDYFATTVDGTTYLGLMNRAPTTRTITPRLDELGLDAGATYTAYDVEDDHFERIEGAFAREMPPRSFRLLVLRREPGVLWTSSSFAFHADPGRLVVDLNGPVEVPGDMALASPSPRAVTLDGAPLVMGAPGCWYDAEAGVLHLRYDHDRPHRLEVLL